MTKTLLVVVAISAACASQQPSTSLSKLNTARLGVVSNGSIAIELHVDGDCPMLREDLFATFDGQPMNVARGGYATNATGCYPIGFWFDPMPAAALATFESGHSISQLEVIDPSAVWHIDATPLFTEASAFVDNPASATITWNGVATITTAETSPIVPVTISGNTIKYPAGTAINWVSARSHPVPTRCDGPESCTIDLDGEATLHKPN